MLDAGADSKSFAADLPGNGRMVAVLGDSLAAEETAGLLEEVGWRVARIPAQGEPGMGARLDGASVVVVDGTGGKAGSLATLDRARRARPDVGLVLIVPERQRWSAVGPMCTPAPRLAPAPVRRPVLLSALEGALADHRLLAENRALRLQVCAVPSLADWIGGSVAAGRIRQAIGSAALSERPVLILGEDGTGRRFAAELVHRLGPRSALPFLALEVGAFPAKELSALFDGLCDTHGDSDTGRAGLGCVYLRDIGNADAAGEETLERAFRYGAPFRVLASADPGTTRGGSVGSFAGRLLARRDVFAIRIPPLSERRTDIPALVRHFVDQACRKAEVRRYGVAGATVRSYAAYDWPGNTDELRAWIENAVLTAALARHSGTILPQSVCALPTEPAFASPLLGSKSLREALAEVEKGIIRRTLLRAGGNQTRAARILRVNSTTLHEKMKRHGLLRDRGRGTRSRVPTEEPTPPASAGEPGPMPADRRTG